MDHGDDNVLPSLKVAASITKGCARCSIFIREDEHSLCSFYVAIGIGVLLNSYEEGESEAVCISMD